MTIPASPPTDTTGRARLWRLAIGGSGLLWVCAMIWLLDALNP